MAAVGFSLGWLVHKSRPLKRIAKFGIAGALVVVGLRYAVPPVTAFASALPPVSASVVALVAAVGFLLFGAAAFAYVLFAFLSRLTQSDAGIRRDFQAILEKAAHPLRTVAGTAPQEGTGTFTPYSEDRAYLQEQFDELVKAKILKPEDDLDQILKEGEIDLEMLKTRGVTTE